MAAASLSLDEQQSLLYQTSNYCYLSVMKKLTKQLGPKDVGNYNRDPVMNLHQALARVCARATAPPKDNSIAVQTEVVACHFDMQHEGQNLPVIFAKNSEWTPSDQEYVRKLFELLIQAMKPTGAPVDTAKLVDLSDHIYKYCAVKVWSNLSKLVESMEKNRASGRVPDPLFKAMLETLQGFLELYNKGRQQRSAYRYLARASNYCHRNPSPAQFANIPPLVIKRWKKVASYCVSFNVLANWASKQGSYAGTPYQGKFLAVDKFSAPASLPNVAHFTAADLAKHYDGAYRAQDGSRDQKIKDLRPIPENSSSAQRFTLVVHAEMHMVPHIFHEKLQQGSQYIGISKPCCFLCFQAIQSLREVAGGSQAGKKNDVLVNGTHNKLYPEWMIPRDGATINVEGMRPAEISQLQGKVNDAILEQIRGGGGHGPRTADSDWISGNPSDEDLAPDGGPY